MKKEKTIKTHQRRLKNGKVVTVHEHKASYDAAEALREAAKKKGAGSELEALKKKKPVAQDEEVKSPYDEYGFTKDEFKEWYEGTGSKADKKVEKALRKALGRKAYTELNDQAADSYKKGGADKFFNTSLKKMDSATSKDTKFSKEKSVKEGTMKSPADSFKEGEKVSYRNWRNSTTRGKAVGKSFTFSDEDGKYTGQFVMSSDGEYSLVLREDGKKGNFEYLSVGALPSAAKKAMKANGLKEGEWNPGGRVYFEKVEKPLTKDAPKIAAQSKYGFTKSDWESYQNDGSDSDVNAKVEKALKKYLGAKAYKQYGEYQDKSINGEGVSLEGSYKKAMNIIDKFKAGKGAEVLAKLGKAYSDKRSSREGLMPKDEFFKLSKKKQDAYFQKYINDFGDKKVKPMAALMKRTIKASKFRDFYGIDIDGNPETPKSPKAKEPRGKAPDGYMGLSKSDLKKRIAEIAAEFEGKGRSRDFRVTGGTQGSKKVPWSYRLPNGSGGGFKTEQEALTALLKAAEKLQKNNPNLEKGRPGGKRKLRSAGSKSPEDELGIVFHGKTPHFKGYSDYVEARRISNPSGVVKKAIRNFEKDMERSHGKNW